MNERKIYWPSGKTLCGPSVGSGLIFVRGLPKDYDTCVDTGNVNWSWRDVFLYFLCLGGNE